MDHRVCATNSDTIVVVYIYSINIHFEMVGIDSNTAITVEIKCTMIAESIFNISWMLELESMSNCTYNVQSKHSVLAHVPRPGSLQNNCKGVSLVEWAGVSTGQLQPSDDVMIT